MAEPRGAQCLRGRRPGCECKLSTHDSALVARRLGELRWITCAAPAYLDEKGIPEDLEDLHLHRAVHYFSCTTGRDGELHFVEGGVLIRKRIIAQFSIALSKRPLICKEVHIVKRCRMNFGRSGQR
ncbi:hypothetical protein ACN9MU_18530 [Pseudoduganella sp. R-32]|uniref:hypothetical protein n=1 Tax=Pseudoduganella sp. R-32 TaxID=3404061 RepID=UPI003CFABDE9